jgi:hypothetical protein
MTVRSWACAAALWALGCGGEEPAMRAAGGHEGHEHGEPAATAEPSGPAPTAVLPDGARLFGTALTDRAVTPLSEISASPTTFADQVVHTTGTIERVCQAMGCWMELRAEGVEPVRVPMAGHSFFLPRDVAGRPAEIEGRVMLLALSPEARAHLEGEGATATAGSLSIEATGVVVR